MRIFTLQFEVCKLPLGTYLTNMTSNVLDADEEKKDASFTTETMLYPRRGYNTVMISVAFGDTLL